MKLEYIKKQFAFTSFWNWFEKSVNASCYLIAMIIHQVNASRNFEYRSIS